MIARVYLDTSVVGGCKDEEFSEWSIKLFREIQEGDKVAVVSDLTLKELEEAPQNVKSVLNDLNEENIEYVGLSDESVDLAKKYLSENVVGEKHIIDAQHIAVASVERVDVLASWNFKQIVNLDKIHAFNAVNMKMGYPVLEIRSPREIVNEKEI